jgi:glycosyltransferase involved in cell wall biosynthesis
VGGNVEIIKDNETGILTKVKDSSDLAAAMTKLATNSVLREKLGKNARHQYEEKFQLTTMIKTGIIPLYEGKR